MVMSLLPQCEIRERGEGEGMKVFNLIIDIVIGVFVGGWLLMAYVAHFFEG